MARINTQQLLGWTEDQFRRAARSCSLAFDDDWFGTAFYACLSLSATDNPAVHELRNIKRAWLRRGGPIEGPSDAILLPEERR